MGDFLPHYLNFDVELPTEKHFEFDWFYKDSLAYIVDWTNITYSKADFDMQDIQIEIVPGRTDKPNDHFLKVDFPAIKNWTISATQVVNTWIIPASSDIQLDILDLDMSFETSLNVDRGTGEIKPVFVALHLDFGGSYLYHDNWFVALFMHQVVYFAKIVVENSIIFLGLILFNDMFTPVLTEILGNYEYATSLPSPFTGQDTHGVF